MASRAIPESLRGLLGLSIIHFARWIIIRRDQWPDLGQGKQSLRNDYMLFCSNFNGTWDQYIDAFSDAIPDGLDLLWYSSTSYPHSIPIGPFKSYIRANQIDTNYYYNSVSAWGGDIGGDEQKLQAANTGGVHACVRRVAGCVTSIGFVPVTLAQPPALNYIPPGPLGGRHSPDRSCGRSVVAASLLGL